MSTDSWIALAAFVVSILSVVLHLGLRRSDHRKSRHASVLAALQGTKEAVGYEAHRIATEGWPKDVLERSRVRDALCMAFIFERSDRSRALVQSALKTASPDDREGLVDLLQSLTMTFRELEREPEWDFHRAWPKIAILGTALGARDITENAKAALREGIEARSH